MVQMAGITTKRQDSGTWVEEEIGQESRHLRTMSVQERSRQCVLVMTDMRKCKPFVTYYSLLQSWQRPKQETPKTMLHKLQTPKDLALHVQALCRKYLVCTHLPFVSECTKKSISKL